MTNADRVRELNDFALWQFITDIYLAGAAHEEKPWLEFNWLKEAFSNERQTYFPHVFWEEREDPPHNTD